MPSVETLDLRLTDGPSTRAPRVDALPADHQAVRLEMICRIRRQIDLGNYENDQRLRVALDRLLADMM